MPSKKHRSEEIIGKLPEAEVVLAQGPRRRKHVGRSRSASRPIIGSARNRAA